MVIGHRQWWLITQTSLMDKHLDHQHAFHRLSSFDLFACAQQLAARTWLSSLAICSQ
jgi:hypothetical protein